MATPVILYSPNGKPLLIGGTPWGDVQMAVEPIRVYGNFKAATNSGVQTQTVIGCPSGQALYVTDIVLSASKTANATVTVRFHDGTNTENIVVMDVSDKGNQLSMHPQGRTLGWEGAYIQLVTDTALQAATMTVWYVRVKGEYVLSYAKWSSLR